MKNVSLSCTSFLAPISHRSGSRRRLRAVAALTAALLVLGGALVPQASANGVTQVTQLSFSWSGGTLVRTQVRFVTVSVTLVDPAGVPVSGIIAGDSGLTCPCVALQNVSTPVPGSTPGRIVTLHRTSGTSTNGVWSGRFAVGAADAGIWHPSQIAAGTLVGHNPAVPPPDDETLTDMPAPFTQRSMNVRGYDWPRAWLGTPVRSGSRYVVSGGVSLNSSAMPVAGLRLELREVCTPDPTYTVGTAFRMALRTNAAGRYSYLLTAAEAHKVTYACTAAVVYPTDTRNSWVFRSNIRLHG
jgi:hypothetical protein